MRYSTKKFILSYVALVAVFLPFAYFFAAHRRFWIYTALVIMTAICGIVVAIKQRSETARFGTRMTFDEIIGERDRLRMVQLLRYHLGWSPGKIAAELNRSKITNHGLPWGEHDVQAIVKGIAGRL